MGKDLEKSRYYLGTAQVKLRNLCFSYSNTEPDNCTGCCISDLEHNLPALIKPSSYYEILATCRIPRCDLYQIGPSPKLSLPESLKLPCLHGQFRLENAERYNPDKLDEWWTVDLFSSNTTASTLTYIRQHYKKHLDVCDGEKYLHIRYHERQNNELEAVRWRGLLSVSKAKNLNQILRNGWLCEVLDKLEPFRSLWVNFQISSFPPVLSWRCSPEIDHYLGQIQRMWHDFTGGDGSLCDEETVEKLQGLAPQWSSRDRSIVETLFTTKRVFSRVSDPSIRDQMLKRVLAVDGVILTFRTFFKHVKVLEPVMLRLRELFPPSELFPQTALMNPSQRRLPSIKEILLQKCYKRPLLELHQCLLQYSEHEEHYVESRNTAIYSYWQLCLFLLRYQHGAWRPSKKTKKWQSLDSPAWLIRLGHFAHRLGFESDRILELSQQDADHSDIRQHMLQERPDGIFYASPEKFDAEIRSRKQGQNIFEPFQLISTPPMTTDSDAPNRAPRTHPQLFLPTIWEALAQEKRYILTDYGELLLILMAFFGDFTLGNSNVAREDPQMASSIPCPSSVYSLPEDYFTLRPSVYSLPDNPFALQATSTDSLPETPAEPQDESSALRSLPIHYEPPPTYHRRPMNHIFFWHLPKSRTMKPILEYRCEATVKGIEAIVREMAKKDIAPLFTLIDNDGRLKLCAPLQILHRRKRLDNPNDVFFIYSTENRLAWIMKRLGST